MYRHIADLAGIKEVMMPVPALNIINGGSHAGNKLAMQVIFVRRYNSFRDYEIISKFLYLFNFFVSIPFLIFLGIYDPSNRSILIYGSHEDG